MGGQHLFGAPTKRTRNQVVDCDVEGTGGPGAITATARASLAVTTRVRRFPLTGEGEVEGGEGGEAAGGQWNEHGRNVMGEWC